MVYLWLMAQSLRLWSHSPDAYSTHTLLARARRLAGTPASVVLQLTTAEGVGQHFKSASATIPVDAACAAVKCG